MKILSFFSVASFATLVLMGVSCKKKDDTASNTGGGGNSGNGATDSTAYKGISNLPKKSVAYIFITSYDSIGTKIVGYTYDTITSEFTYDSKERLVSRTNTKIQTEKTAKNVDSVRTLSNTFERFCYTGNAIWPDSSRFKSSSILFNDTMSYIYGYNTALGLPYKVSYNFFGFGMSDSVFYNANATNKDFTYSGPNVSCTVANGNSIKKTITSATTGTSTFEYFYTNYANPYAYIKGFAFNGGSFEFPSYNLLSSLTFTQTLTGLVNISKSNVTYSFDASGRISGSTLNQESRLNNIVFKKTSEIGILTY